MQRLRRAAATPAVITTLAIRLIGAIGAIGACTTSAPNDDGPRAPPVPPPKGPVDVHWDLELLPGWQLAQRVCWRGAQMQYVMPEARSALAYVVDAHDGEGRVLAVTQRGLDVTQAECASLTVDLAKAAFEIDDDDAIAMFGKVVYGSPDMWLWRPEPWPAGTVGTLSLKLPDGMVASLPWPKGDDGKYRVDSSTWKLMAKAALGEVEVKTMEIGEATFTLAKLPGDLRVSDAGIERWLKDAAGAVSLVGGAVHGAPKFPVRHAQILLVPVPAGGAIPFGMAMRGGGPTAMMLVSALADDQDLVGEWVGVHELSHLLLPPLVSEDAWLSEGLASYYQQTLRGRAGILPVEESWGLLVDGFDRGRRASRDVSLRDASTRMRRDFGYLHVYWGGAAVMLMLDVELRKNGTSLDAVVAGIRQREPKDTVYRTADEVVGWMQELAPHVDVEKVVERGLSQRFPPVEPLLDDLGIRRGRSINAVLRDDAKLVEIRKQIIGVAAP